MPEVEDRVLHRHYLRFAFTVVIVAAAFLLRAAIVRYIGAELPTFITFYPAIMVVGLLCGLGPGLLATALCVLAADYWLTPPRGNFAIASSANLVALLLFATMGIYMSVVAEVFRRNQRRVAGLKSELALHESQEELRRSEEQFATLANAIPQLCWMAKADGHIFWYNERWYAYTGTTAQQMEGWGWQSVHDPEALPKVLERWKSSVATGEPFDMVFPLKGADGVFRPFLTRVMPVKDAEGKAVRWFGTNTDISEQKRIEIELRKSKERLDLAVEVAGLGEWELNLKDRTSTHSLRHDEIFGYSSALPEWSYEKFLEHVLPGLRDDFDQKFRAAGSSWSLETQIRRADGEVRWIWARGRRRVNEVGQVVRMYGVTSDITERKRAEEARARLAAIVDSSGDAIIGKDLSGIVSSWNKSAEQLFGYSAEEMIGQPITRIIPPERQYEEAEFLERLRGGKSIVHWETVRLNKRGRSIDVSVTLSPIRDAGGAIIGISKSVRDVTERKQAEEELRQQADMLRLSFDAIILWRLDGGIESWNRGAELLYGYSEGEALGQVTHDLLRTTHPIPFPQVEATLRECGNWQGELRHITKDGRKVTVSARHQLIASADGVERVLETNRDITERKQVEEALRLRVAALDAAANSIVMTDAAGVIQWVNPAFTKMTGYTAEEAIGQNPRVLKSGKHEDQFYKDMWKQVLSGWTWRGELINRRKDGSTYVEEMTITPVRAADGTITNFLAVKEDITQRKRAEAALQASEHRWSTTLQSIGDAVISTDATGRIDFMNEVAQKLTGWKLEEAKGRELPAVFDIVQEVTRIRPESPVAKVIRLGKIVGLANHTVLIHRDGNEIPIEDSAAPIRDSNGQMEGVVLVFHDVLEQRRVEAALRSSERLATTGRLAATIAHEIHNPLDAVGNLLFLISQETKEESTGEYAGMASGELARVTQMTQQMLGFQREASKPESVRIGEILANVLALYDRKIKTAGIHLEQRIDYDAQIIALPGELRQIFANLVGNAIEAVGSRHGTIALRAYPSHDRRRGVPGVCVVVADNGSGIPAEVRSKIFEPFFTTKGEGGTGLGLWITSDILRKYDGTMRLRSCTRPERSGTCFSIFLPFEVRPDSTE